MSKLTSRSAALYVIALSCMLWADVACAQDSPSDLVTRIDRLEETVRNLTGSVQELQYRNQQLEQEVQRLQAGAIPAASTVPAPPPRSTVSTALPPPATSQYSPPGSQYSPPGSQRSSPPAPQNQPLTPVAPYRPPPYYQQQPPPAPVIANAPSGPGHDAFNPAIDPNAPGAPRPLGSSRTATEPPPPAPDTGGSGQPGAPLNLSNISTPGGGAAAGTLPPPPPTNPNATGVMQEASLPPNATPKDEYDLAYSYVRQKNYGLAAQTFRDFLQKYPGERQTPEAQYWLGESLFQDQKYHDAAEAFLAVSTKYETSGHAPDALLRLGESLAAMGEKEAACASLGEVLRKYPHASIGVRQNVDREQKRVHC